MDLSYLFFDSQNGMYVPSAIDRDALVSLIDECQDGDMPPDEAEQHLDECVKEVAGRKI